MLGAGMLLNWYLKKLSTSPKYTHLKANTHYTDATYPHRRFYNFIFGVWVMVFCLLGVGFAVATGLAAGLLVFNLLHTALSGAVAIRSFAPVTATFVIFLPAIVPAFLLCWYGIPRTPGLNRYMSYFYIKNTGMNLMKDVSTSNWKIFGWTALSLIPCAIVILISTYFTSSMTPQRTVFALDEFGKPLLNRKTIDTRDITLAHVVIFPPGRAKNDDAKPAEMQIMMQHDDTWYRFTPATALEIEGMIRTLHAANVPILHDKYEQFSNDLMVTECKRSLLAAAYGLDNPGVTCKGSFFQKSLSGT